MKILFVCFKDKYKYFRLVFSQAYIMYTHNKLVLKIKSYLNHELIKWLFGDNCDDDT